MLARDHEEGRQRAQDHPALFDPDTGLASRLHFDLVYGYLFEAGDRGMPFSLMLVSFPEGRPHEPDRIDALGEKIHTTTRSADLVSNVGDDRFVVVLLGANLPGARIAADRVEMALQDMSPGSVAFGIAAYDPEMKRAVELLEATDQALLAAEAAGGGVEMA